MKILATTMFAALATTGAALADIDVDNLTSSTTVEDSVVFNNAMGTRITQRLNLGGVHAANGEDIRADRIDTRTTIRDSVIFNNAMGTRIDQEINLGGVSSR